MYFEVVKTWPTEGIRYHVRLKTEEDRILLWSTDFPAEHIAHNLIDAVRAFAPTARVVEVDET
jgi:uncharacterized protein YegP (UPF0339 family)